MPALPTTYPFLPSAGDLPLRTSADWLALLPDHVRREPLAPVRDAIAEAAAGVFLSYQSASGRAAAQSDGTRATGRWLEAIAADVEIIRRDDEDDEALRDRLYGVPLVVSPFALRAGANEALVPFTSSECAIFESVLDRWYIQDGSIDWTLTWHSFVTDGTASVDPDYPDRHYEEREGSGPGGLWAFDGYIGRYFIVRLPRVVIAELAGYAYDATQDVATGFGLFLTNGTNTDGDCNGILFSAVDTAQNVYQRVVDAILQIKGYGVRFLVMLDPKL